MSNKASAANKGTDTPDTEQRILLAAEAEFLVKGFDGARTSSIAERAGVTHAMLHYYFRTKEKLFVQVIREKLDEMKNVMFGFAATDTVPLFERIAEGIRRHFDFVMQNPSLPLFVVNEFRRENSPLKTQMEANCNFARTMVGCLQSEIDEQSRQGVCRKVDASMLIMDIISLNIFSFIGAPIFSTLLGDAGENTESMLLRRREANVETILQKLRP